MADLRLDGYRLPIARRSLSRYGKALGIADSGVALTALARAIASSPVWESLPSTVLVVRRSPKPLLAVISRFDHAGKRWLEAQARTLDADCGRLKWVGYPQVEEDCVHLASLLTDRLGRDEIRRARFVAIPRGGLVVLGLLATALGLEREQLEPPHAIDQPLVAVDDCALSGTRFRSFLRCYQEPRRVTFAHLYSPPELRVAIESQENRVLACISARDLETAELQDPDTDSTGEFLNHMKDAYCAARTEPLAFPWGEPDRLIWDPVTDRPAQAWNLAPPQLCLKNRARPSIPVQVLPPAKGPLRPGQDVVFGELEGKVVLLQLNRSQSATLNGVASDMWRTLVRHGDPSKLVADLRRTYSVSGGRLQRDAADFTDHLIDRGFLEWKAAPNSPDPDG